MATISEALAIALQHYRAGRLQAAERIYRQILAVEPNHAETLFNLGDALNEQGKLDEAIACYRRALQRTPDFAAAHNNLGVAFSAQGNVDQAATCWRRALELSPDFAEAHNNLGKAFMEQGNLDDAAACYRRALELKPDFAQACNNLGAALNGRGKLEEAIACFRRAVALKPDFAEAYNNLALALQQQGEQEEAIAVWRRCVQIAPEDSVARHMLAAGTGRSVPARCADGYIRSTFDRFAQTFDDTLRRLGYRGPELVAAAIAKQLGAARGNLDVLDAGCGTGLCGPLLRPYARRLSGVDLSSGMLRKAQARQVYDDLTLGELTAYLEGLAERYDLIASADTLIYFGDLRPVLAAAARALRPGGLLVFTVEKAGDGDRAGDGFSLQYHGRYCHAEEYVRLKLIEARLTLRELGFASVRREVGQPVQGMVASARKAASS
jgi:predicted TPR repeat methyltransferase